jgi:Tfp pilus assembly protein PilV
MAARGIDHISHLLHQHGQALRPVVEQAQQAQQAGQTYQQAAAAPPPEQAPGAGFFDQLLGNTASVISQNPNYQKQAAERGQQSQKDLMTRRADNLMALKDQYDKQAAAAEKIGLGDINEFYAKLVGSPDVQTADEHFLDSIGRIY